MIEMSESIQDLAAALAKAQGRIEGAVKASDNAELNSRYADLTAVWAACRQALTKNGLSVVQFPGELVDGGISMTTMLMHSSGQWLQQSLAIPLRSLSAQGYGATITYARRYALAAVVGVCPEEDHSMAASALAPRLTRSPAPCLGGNIDEDMLAALIALADDVNADHQAFCAYLGIASLRELPVSQYQAALRALEQKRVGPRRAA